jgi:hypothetical protein
MADIILTESSFFLKSLIDFQTLFPLEKSLKTLGLRLASRQLLAIITGQASSEGNA